MKKYFIILLIMLSLSLSAQDPIIARYEQTGKRLFIRINSSVTPNAIEHFFSPRERADSVSILKTIAALEAQLAINDSLYVSPDVTTNKINRAKKFSIDPDLIKRQRKKLLSKRLLDDAIAHDAVSLPQDTTNIFIP